MKQAIFNDWNFMRVLRLAIGIAILVQALMAKDAIFGIAGLLFTSMAIFNVGCCGTASCRTPTKKNTQSEKDINYEEVV
jgi:hypothetical protein